MIEGEGRGGGASNKASSTVHAPSGLAGNSKDERQHSKNECLWCVRISISFERREQAAAATSQTVFAKHVRVTQQHRAAG